jgi:hypothetical protein
MSSVVGMIHASVLLLYSIPCQQDLDYYFTEGSMPKGLLCYSEPKLLLNLNNRKRRCLYLYFISICKQHYKIRGIFTVFNLWYESKLPIFSFFFLYFTKEEGSDIYLDGTKVV